MKLRPIILSAIMLVSACDYNDIEGKAGCYKYPVELIDWKPGQGHGFGSKNMPTVILGYPGKDGSIQGSLDVVSLGKLGEVVVGFGDYDVVDGPGPDFIVFENSFWISGDTSDPFSELGIVSVSSDGDVWHDFPCNPGLTSYDRFCAGWRPRQLEFDEEYCFFNIEEAGGDTFDLSDLGIDRIRYIKIKDISNSGLAPSAGFDLDGLVAIHTVSTLEN